MHWWGLQEAWGSGGGHSAVGAKGLSRAKSVRPVVPLSGIPPGLRSLPRCAPLPIPTCGRAFLPYAASFLPKPKPPHPCARLRPMPGVIDVCPLSPAHPHLHPLLNHAPPRPADRRCRCYSPPNLHGSARGKTYQGVHAINLQGGLSGKAYTGMHTVAPTSSCR